MKREVSIIKLCISIVELTKAFVSTDDASVKDAVRNDIKSITNTFLTLIDTL